MNDLTPGERVAKFVSIAFVVAFMCYMFLKFIFF
jgi:hypothetical protein